MTELARTIPPIVLTKQESLTPHAYRLVITTTHCTGCGSLNESSELYQINTLRSRIMNKPGVTNSIPIDRFMWNVPFQVRHTMRLRSTPVCHKCFPDLSLSHLPTVPREDTELMNGIAGTAKEATEGRGAPVRRKLTLDDI